MVATFFHQALGPSNWVTGRKHIENVYAMQECVFVIFLNFIAVTRE